MDWKQWNWKVRVFFISLLLLIVCICLLVIGLWKNFGLLAFCIVLPLNIIMAMLELLEKDKNQKKNTEESLSINDTTKKECIAILLPFLPRTTAEHDDADNQNKDKAIKDDCLSQLLGIFRYIKSDEGQSEIDNFEFKFINHGNSEHLAIKKVIKELKCGTKYFFSTMSSVNEKLSEEFLKNNLVNKNNAILVCSATSSTLTTKENRVYRFYPRCKEEAKVLASCLPAEIDKVMTIRIDNNYGLTTESEFFKILDGKTRLASITISFRESYENIKEDISNRSSDLSDNKLAILVCHYGQGITDIVKALDEIVFNNKERNALPLILFTSTLKSETWGNSIKDILKQIRYCIAEPKYKQNKIRYKDVVKDFAEMALKKFVNTIIDSKKSNCSFDTIWTKQNAYPFDLVWRTSKEEKGDSIIEMIVDKKNIN